MSNTGSLTVVNNTGMQIVFTESLRINQSTAGTNFPSYGATLESGASTILSMTASGTNTSGVALSFLCNNSLGSLVYCVPISSDNTFIWAGYGFSINAPLDGNDCVATISLGGLSTVSASVVNNTGQQITFSWNNSSDTQLANEGDLELNGSDVLSGLEFTINNNQVIRITTMFCGNAYLVYQSYSPTKGSSLFTTSLIGAFATPVSSFEFSIEENNTIFQIASMISH